MAIEQQICCWGASKWTRVVAVFQILKNLLLLILRITLLALAIADFNDKTNKGGGSYKISINLWAVLIHYLGPVVGIIMAVVLLKGSNQRRADRLKIWMIYAIVCLALALLSIIWDLSVLNITLEVLFMATDIFSIFVVNIHKKEILLGVVA